MGEVSVLGLGSNLRWHQHTISLLILEYIVPLAKLKVV